jgi:hypothetical protein
LACRTWGGEESEGVHNKAQRGGEEKKRWREGWVRAEKGGERGD